jgi:hypothetical protein
MTMAAFKKKILMVLAIFIGIYLVVFLWLYFKHYDMHGTHFDREIAIKEGLFIADYEVIYADSLVVSEVKTHYNVDVYQYPFFATYQFKEQVSFLLQVERVAEEPKQAYLYIKDLMCFIPEKEDELFSLYCRDKHYAIQFMSFFKKLLPECHDWEELPNLNEDIELFVAKSTGNTKEPILLGKVILARKK